jgi:protein-tyrosine phosphatase
VPRRGYLPSLSQCELQRDVATIARWGAKALVTLLDEVELARLHLHKLARLIAAVKITWYHVPLSFGILPDAEFDRGWNRVSLRLQQILREGGKVSIHCRDGRDRTGLMTARLLIELGCHPLDAMNRVRAARPGMLENAELEDYLRRVQASRLEAVTRLELLQDGSSAVGSRAAPLHSEDRSEHLGLSSPPASTVSAPVDSDLTHALR